MINPVMVIPFADFSGELFAELLEKHGSEDLELFAVGSVIQNRYQYQCWNEEDEVFVRGVNSELELAKPFLKDV